MGIEPHLAFTCKSNVGGAPDVCDRQTISTSLSCAASRCSSTSSPFRLHDRQSLRIDQLARCPARAWLVRGSTFTELSTLYDDSRRKRWAAFLNADAPYTGIQSLHGISTTEVRVPDA